MKIGEESKKLFGVLSYRLSSGGNGESILAMMTVIRDRLKRLSWGWVGVCFFRWRPLNPGESVTHDNAPAW